MSKIRAVLVAVVALALAACSAPVRLEQAPNLFHVGEGYPAAEVPPQLRTTQATIYYVTDRKAVHGAGFIKDYNYERSASMAFGETWVEFGRNLDWNGLVAQSTLTGGQSLSLQNNGFAELIRFKDTPIPFTVKNGKATPNPQAQRDYEGQLAEFRGEIARELRETSQRDAVVYIHGFNTEFQDALSTTAALWHYSGRFGIPISYSWPAGNPGVFKYFKDREAGEFSLFHLKEFLRSLAEIRGLEKIHIVAHSRGADVVTSAIRELAIFERGAGRSPSRKLKIENLILAAPDLDFGVVQQRLAAEHLSAAVGQISVYLNPNDGALGLAQRLATGRRLGRLDSEDLSAGEADLFAALGNVSFINVEDAGGRLGHSYFRRNPAVFSDIILTMRTGDLPGTTVRPMENLKGNFWTIHADYPAPRPVAIEPPSFSENE